MGQMKRQKTRLASHTTNPTKKESGSLWNVLKLQRNIQHINKRKKPLRKTIEDAKNLTKEKVNPQAMANPIIPRDMSNIMKILLAILQQNQANQSLFEALTKAKKPHALEGFGIDIPLIHCRGPSKPKPQNFSQKNIQGLKGCDSGLSKWRFILKLKSLQNNIS